MKSVGIIGAGGFGREVLEIYKDQNKIKSQWDILGFIDDNPEIWGKKINAYPVLGGLDWLKNNKHDLGVVCAIAEPIIKKKIIDDLTNEGVKFFNAVHPSVIMSDSVEIGTGVIICAGCILTVNIKIGNHVILNINSTVGHDTIIEDYCSIMPTVKINGNNHIGIGNYIGTGATFIQDLQIGAWTTIGAGAVVTNNIPENVVAVGIPAKVIKQKNNLE